MKKIVLVAAVGDGQRNKAVDVKAIQDALNELSDDFELEVLLSEDGDYGKKTGDAIAGFQSKCCGLSSPDRVISPNGRTIREINARLEKAGNNPGSILPWYFMFAEKPETGLSESDYEQAAKTLDCEVAAIKAFAECESSGSGFLACGLPKILFEGHKFHKYTNGAYDESHPQISYPKWDRSKYYSGFKEYQRLQEAMLLDSDAALKSASFGRFQICGFNYEMMDYETVKDYVKDIWASEPDQLDSFCHFIKSEPALHKAIQELDWATAAKHYNGPSYAQNHYDVRLGKAYAKYA